VEPGESLEAGVAREVKEEVGVSVRDLRYLGSQPWPFPRSLLIAFTAEADDGQAIDVGENGEFMEARWVHRDIVLAAAGSGGVAPGLVLPPATSIAHRMLVDWALAG
jgi:NAD+ diphosphatase